MTYEQEQIKYAEELKQVSKELKGIEYFFADPNQTNIKIIEHYKRYNPFKYNTVSELDIERFRLLLEKEYRNKKARKKELERLLSQTLAERTKNNIKNNIGKTVEYFASITPQHVSGRVYKVENGDGCGKFCLWFMIIDAIIVLLYWLISGGK